MNKQYFQVIGKEELLKNCKINLVKIDDQGNESIHTLLCNGKLNKIGVEDDAAFIYKFYISYKDSYVEMLKMENIFRNALDQINNLYIEEEDENVFIKFVGRKSDLNSLTGFQKTLILKNEYYELHNIRNDEARKKTSFLFFECKQNLVN